MSILHYIFAGIEKSDIFIPLMRPDYPNKLFTDERGHYILLMQALAEDAAV